MNAFKSVFGACVLELSVLLQTLQLRWNDIEINLACPEGKRQATVTNMSAVTYP